MLLRRGCRGIRQTGHHAAQRVVFVDDRVFEGSADVREDRQGEHGCECCMYRSKDRRELRVFGNKRQGLTKRPPDRRKAFGGGVVDPAGQWHQQHAAVKHPMGGLGRKGFEAVLSVQKAGACLGQCPEYA